jgi:Gram-negative porin
MDMFGGLTKTSSRIAIAAALGLTLGGFAFKATPAKAADLGGDCCADLEERVAELEATTVRKGNKKVSVTLSGWVVKSMNWWDDGHEASFAVGDKDYDLASRFAITGSATIAPGWSGGYNLTVTTSGTGFGISSNQVDEFGDVNARLGFSSFGNINTLYSYIYIKSDRWGTLNWGHLSPASDNPAVLADISGTVIESNFVGFEGAGFGLRAKGAPKGALFGSWNSFWLCDSAAAPGADCFGTAEPAVRYDSPTWGGFRFETSYGTYDVVNAILDDDARRSNSGTGLLPHPATRDSHFWDIAAFYTGDWDRWKLSLAYAFTWMETNPLNGGEETQHQVGGSIMHKPTGLGVYAMGEWELANNADFKCGAGGGAPCLINDSVFGNGNLPDTDMWGVKPFWRKAWTPLGATVLYGEFAQYNDYYGLANATLLGDVLPACTSGLCNVTGSQVERWGLGVVQEIDAAAMHVWFRWQHQDLKDVSLIDLTNDDRLHQGFDNFDLFQAGGIIFF